MNSSIRILLAEDHRLFRELLIPCLQEFNIFTIAEAENGKELLHLLKKKLPDILLLDLEMPEMNGVTALSEIQTNWPKLKIIILTNHDLIILQEQLLSGGAKAYLTKNTEIKILAQTIISVHEGNYLQPVSAKRVHSLNGDPKFSKREFEMIPLIVDGCSNKEIADKLKIGSKAVEAHKKNLFKKTKTQSAVGFVSYVFKKGLNFLK